MSITPHINRSNQRAFSLTTYDKVNLSPSQAKYTFSKANRFPSIKQNCPVGAYENKTQLSKRAAGLGYGQAGNFYTKSISPSPDKYANGTIFDHKNTTSRNALGQPKKSFCFGAGREDFSKTVYNTGMMYPDKVVPGPGLYEDQTRLIKNTARKTALKERKFYLDDEEQALKIGNPGPGQYEDQQAFQKKGQYVSSLYGNSKATKITTSSRWQANGRVSPGPGDYDELGNIASGRQVCSNFHSTVTKNLGTTEPRTQWGGHPRFASPAPGTYRPPSDFGYLEFKNQLRDGLNGSQMTGFDTSTSALKIAMIDSSNVPSLRSGKRHSLRNPNSQVKNMEIEGQKSVRIFAKKRSLGNMGHNSSSRNADMAQNSTLYSMNNSGAASPRNNQTLTPMAFNSELPDLRKSTPRQNRTPQGQSLPNVQPKYKMKAGKHSNTMTQMAQIYADQGAKHQKQEAAASQIRQQHNLQQQKKQEDRREVSEKPDTQEQVVSELGNKPGDDNTGDDQAQAPSADLN